MVVYASDLRLAYNAAAHPRVLRGQMTEEEAFHDFFSDFSDKDGDGKVTYSEWSDYFSAVSCGITKDENFVFFMKKFWKL